MKHIQRHAGIAKISALIFAAIGVRCSLFATSTLGLGVGASCSQNKDCQSQLCELQVCSSVCMTNADCPAPSVCEAQRCKIGCQSDDDCKDKQICEKRTCRVGCRGNQQCGLDEFCENMNPSVSSTGECYTVVKVTALLPGPVSGQNDSSGLDNWSISHKIALDKTSVILPYVKSGEVPYRLEEKVQTVEQFHTSIEAAVARGSNVIVTASPVGAQAVSQVAPQYKDKVKFITMGADGNQNAPNVQSYIARTEPAWFALGQVAAKIVEPTKSCVGMILPFPTPQLVRDTNAFALGLRTAFAPNNPPRVVVRWVGATRDPSEAKLLQVRDIPQQQFYREELLAAELASAGCKLIMHRTDTSRVNNAVEKKIGVVSGIKIFSLGLDRKESCYSDPTNPQTWMPTCVGSISSDWEPVYRRIFTDIFKRTWQPQSSEDVFNTSQDSSVKVDWAPDSIKLPIATQEVTDTIQKAAQKGIDLIFQDSYKFNGQRDADNDHVADGDQSVNKDHPISKDELDRMCAFIEGVYEFERCGDRGLSCGDFFDNGKNLVPALVPYGPKVVGQVTTLEESGSLQKYGDLVSFIQDSLHQKLPGAMPCSTLSR